MQKSLWVVVVAINLLVPCPECKEGVSAAGCHHCAGCDRVMHAFCGIAAPGSVEGFGARRVCTDCQGQNLVRLTDLITVS